MGLGKGFPFALERDYVHARRCDCLRRNDRLEFVL